MTITTTQETPTATSTPERRETTALADAAAPPRLVLDHHPGFSFEDGDVGTADPYTVVFCSKCDSFPLCFQIDYFIRQGELSASLLPSDYELEANTVDDLVELGDGCDRLQRWFDDCASVLSWALRTYRGKEVTAMG